MCKAVLPFKQVFFFRDTPLYTPNTSIIVSATSLIPWSTCYVTPLLCNLPIIRPVKSGTRLHFTPSKVPDERPSFLCDPKNHSIMWPQSHFRWPHKRWTIVMLLKSESNVLCRNKGVTSLLYYIFWIMKASILTLSHMQADNSGLPVNTCRWVRADCCWTHAGRYKRNAAHHMQAGQSGCAKNSCILWHLPVTQVWNVHKSSQ